MYTPSSTAFLRPTRGGFEFVEYDNNAFPYPQTIGSTAPSISGLGPADENMMKTIFIMPNKSTNPDATLMIVVDEVDPPTDPKTYQYVYVGNINDLPSDVLTEGSIVDIPGTGLKSVMSQKGATDLVNEYNVSTNNNNAEYTFAQAVALVPVSLQKGGLTIKYIDSTTHKYAIKRLMSSTWNTTESNWQGIDDEPIAGSNNLVKSGGVVEDEYFNVFIRSNFKLHYSHSGTGTYIPNNQRNAITSPLMFDTAIKVVCKSGSSFAYQYYDGYQTGPTHLIEAGSSWLSELIIPAGTYWCMIIRNNDDSITTQETTDKLSFSGVNSGELILERFNEVDDNIDKVKGSISLAGYIDIDNAEKTITLREANLVYTYNNVIQVLNVGYSMSYQSTIFNSIVSFLYYNYDTNTLGLCTINNFTKYPIVAKLVTGYNSSNINKIYYCAVNVKLNNKFYLYNDIFSIAIREVRGTLSSYGYINIDTTNKTIKLIAGDLIYNFGGSSTERKTLSVGYTTSYSGLSFLSGIIFLYYNYDNNSIGISSISNFNDYPIIAKLQGVYGTNTIQNVYWSCIDVMVDNMIFSPRRISQIQDILVGSNNPYTYTGEKISFNTFDVKPFITLSNPWSQSMAIYNDYVVFFSNSGNKAYLYNISTKQQLAQFDIPNGGYYQPHCNTAMCGIEFATEDSIMPVIYLSQWDAGHERACFVLDVSFSDDTYSLSIVQKINLSAISSSIIGVGECDFAVDLDNNLLYAIAYKTSVSDANKGTSTMVCSVNLPELNDGSVITLTDSDIINHFETELIEYRQDSFMRNGKIYFANGGLNSIKGKISVIDVLKESVVTKVPVYLYQDSEPECIDIYKNKILYNYGSNLLEILI